jgi:hypothetical protein
MSKRQKTPEYLKAAFLSECDKFDTDALDMDQFVDLVQMLTVREGAQAVKREHRRRRRSREEEEKDEERAYGGKPLPSHHLVLALSAREAFERAPPCV